MLPMKYGEPLTPLRAYAHDVPRYYMQDFGNAVSHPNSRFYSAFMQDTFRVTRNFTLNAGLRYDLQTFEPGTLAEQSAVRAVGQGSDRPQQLLAENRLCLFARATVSRWSFAAAAACFICRFRRCTRRKWPTTTACSRANSFSKLMIPAQAALFPTILTRW